MLFCQKLRLSISMNPEGKNKVYVTTLFLTKLNWLFWNVSSYQYPDNATYLVIAEIIFPDFV